MNQGFIQRLRAHVGGQEDNPITDSGSLLCTTMEGTSSPTGELFWIQLHSGRINFQHLERPEKDNVLGEILDELDIPGGVELEPASFVTFEVSQLETPAFDAMMNRLLLDYFEATESDSIGINTASL